MVIPATGTAVVTLLPKGWGDWVADHLPRR
jgi:hypothetical protein